MPDTVQQKPAAKGNDIEENKLWAVIAYLGILCLIPLLAKKDSPFAQFHAKQGLVLFIAAVIVGFVSWIPILGWLVGFLAGIAIFVLWVIGILNALGGKMNKLPVIGQYADQLNI